MAAEVQSERQTYGDHPSQFVDVYDVARSRGTIFSIHGGYWRAKYGLDLNSALATHLSTQGWTVANIEYRRVEPNSDAAWGDMSSDILAAIASVEVRSGPTVALGHSAGGQLALWAAAQPDTTLDAVVGLAPLSDLFLADGLELSNHATNELFGATASERPDLYAAASPLHLLPLQIPQLIVHGQRDEDVPYEMVGDYIETATMLDEDITLLDPAKVDHFDIIDPTHAVWRSIDEWLERARS